MMDYYQIVQKLEEKIKEEQDANTAYRLGDAIMSDQEYDLLVEEINDLQNKLGVINPNHQLLSYDPQKIGVQISDDDERKEKLPVIMASMNKVRDIEEVYDWFRLKKVPIDAALILTPKYDGLSLCVDEENNCAWTRGDGKEGQRSDNHFSKIGDAFHKPVSIYSFGEVVMRKDVFEEKYSIQALGEEKGYSNARNLVAGKMNDKHPSNVLKDCNFIRYGYYHKKEDKKLSKKEQLDGLNKMNNIQVPYRIVSLQNLDDQFFISLFQEWKENYEIDGVIIDINDPQLREKFGRDTKDNPHFAKAYKNPSFAQSKETIIKGVEWNVSKQGFLKPIVEVDPVILDGARVSHITANNARFVRNMGIEEGERVLVKRSGMVIPQIVAVEDILVPNPTDKKALDEISFKRSHISENLPTHCPSCKSEVGWNETEVELICNNPDCQAQQLERIISFFEIMKVDQVSEGIVKSFYDAGYDTVEKILNMRKKDMESISLFGKRKANIVYNNIHQKMKNVPLSRVQHASGYFKNLGTKKLALVEHLQNPTLEELKAVEGFAEKSAHFYLQGLPQFEKFIANLPITIKRGPSSDKFKGMNIVFTGFRNQQWQEAIEDGGGKVTSSVSKKTNFVVSGEPGSGSSKEKKAQQYGIQIISPQEFEETFGPFEIEENDKDEEEDLKEESDNQLNLF